MNPIARLAKNILLSIDQFGNVLLLGSADETISARSYRKGQLEGHRGWKVMQKFVDKLFWFDDKHTEEAYYAEMARYHMPDSYQNQATKCDGANAPNASTSTTVSTTISGAPDA